MKKFFLIPLFSLLSFTLVHAQLSIVPKVGYTYYSAKFDNMSYGADGFMFRGGFLLGAGFDIAINDMFSIKPEVVYIQKGWKSEASDDVAGYGYIDNSNVMLNYIEVPIMFKFSFGTSTKFFVNGGPYVGFGLSGKDKWDYTSFYAGSIDYEEDGEYKIKFGTRPENDQSDDQYIDNALEIGGQAGIGVLMINRIQFEIRYSYGLTNMFDEDPDIPDNTSKNYGFQINIGVPIGLN